MSSIPASRGRGRHVVTYPVNPEIPPTTPRVVIDPELPLPPSIHPTLDIANESGLQNLRCYLLSLSLFLFFTEEIYLTNIFTSL